MTLHVSNTVTVSLRLAAMESGKKEAEIKMEIKINNLNCKVLKRSQSSEGG